MSRKRHLTTTTNVLRLIELLPDLSLDTIRHLGGRKHAEKRQAALIALIVKTFDGSEKSHNRRPNSVSFGCFELRQRLHAQNSRRCHALLSRFFDFPIERKRFYRGSTKPYTLKPHVIAACETWARESGPAVITSITREDALDAAAVAREQGNLKAAAGLELAAEQSERGLPNVVIGHQSNGRLIPDGSTVNLMTMPKDQRKLLLQQGDYDEQRYDYDLDSCHPRILVNLCRHYGLPHTRLRDYIDAKGHAGEAWAKIVGHDNAGDFKEIVLSLLNGGTLSASPQQTCGRLLGPKRATHFAALKAVAGLAREIQGAMRHVVSRLAHQNNAVGFPFHHDATFEQQCSHILTGYEQFAMRVVCSRLPQDSLITTIHDGWASRVSLSDKALRDMEEQVALTSGRELKITLRVKIRGKPFRDAAYYGFSKEEGETAAVSRTPWYDLSSLHIEKKPH